MKKIELLSPAKDLATGIAAIQHGADAVYIGGPSFGARQAAGNSIEDIHQLCAYAHVFAAKVYVTLNTIIYNEELSVVHKLVANLYEAGVDALITQDLALIPIAKEVGMPLHASTQMDNRSAEKFVLLNSLGYEQAVLARELSLAEIRAIRKRLDEEKLPLQLEGFVHGALCVSYSGSCTASEYCFRRSANRGACAQFCRLHFALQGAENPIEGHLLSLKDMNRSASIEEMMDAGVVSFKIEGRLKDVGFVKNVTAYYRKEIDAVIAKRSKEYCRASLGNVAFSFVPDVNRTFNRGYTDYFLHEGEQIPRTQRGITNFETPKAVGQEIGRIVHIEDDYAVISLNRDITLANGDGLQLGKVGFRANRVEEARNAQVKVFFAPGTDVSMLRKQEKSALYRNHDQQFSANLQKAETATRVVPIHLRVDDTSVFASVIGGDVAVELPYDFNLCDIARTPQDVNIKKQLGKLGGTPYELQELEINFTQPWFIPSSILSDLRRQVVQKLMDIAENQKAKRQEFPATSTSIDISKIVLGGGIANDMARDIAVQLGLHVEEALEVAEDRYDVNAPLMTCRYCLRRELGKCLKRIPNPSAEKSWSLRSADGRVFPLKFDCSRCEMQVLKPCVEK